MKLLGLAASPVQLVLGMTVVAATAFGVTAVVSGVVFNDSKPDTAKTFTSGSVDLTSSPATAAFDVPLMAPGDVVTAPLTVTNTGTLAYRYSVVSVTTENALAAQLRLSIKSGVANCTTGGFSATGIAAYGPSVLGSTAPGTKVMGDVLLGHQSGDRTLAPGDSEALCAQVMLPTTTPNRFKSQASKAVLTFGAEEILAKP